MSRWLFPGDGASAAVEADVRVGGRYDIHMRDPAGGRHHQFGEYREIVHPSRLVFSWSCPEIGVVDSVVTVELEDHERGTELLIRHDLPPDPNIRTAHEQGWAGCLVNLE